MGKTVRNRCPKLLAAIRRNLHIDTTVQSWRDDRYKSRYGRHDEAILRGQDGAIQMDKCQTATIDSEGGYKLNGHDYIYSKNSVTEPKRKARAAGKALIRSQLDN
jgi:hypothetical protein